MKTITATAFVLSTSLLFAISTWQDVVIAAIGAIVSLSGLYQIVVVARMNVMKAEIADIHKATNSLVEDAKKGAAAQATIAERDRVAAIDDKVNLAVKDATVKEVGKDVKEVGKDVTIVKSDVKAGFKDKVKKVVDSLIKKKKKSDKPDPHEKKPEK